jgi:cytochrome c oxidase assembly protein subunit 15
MAKPVLQSPQGSGDILALGFGTSVALWACAYILQLPAVGAPPLVTTAVLCVVLLLGGYFAGRYTRRGWLGGLWTGLLSGTLNLLILGSALGGRDDVMGELPLFALSALGISAVLGILGAAFGNTRRARAAELPNWTAVLSKVAVAATLILIVAGGLVTSHRAGLAVPDWPNSFGHNMFLLPLAEMDKPDVFLEHAHRLWGALVGLTVLTLAVHLSLVRVSNPIRIAAWLAFALVCVQGLLGGLRVTETNAMLGGVHGVLAQLIFGLLASIATATSTIWLSNKASKSYASAGIDRALPLVLLIVLILQAAIGADMRHRDDAGLLMLHIGVATAALALAIATGARAWGLHPDIRALKRRGTGLLHLTGVQLLLGFGAWMMGAPTEAQPGLGDAIVSTMHQANGALLLAWTVGLLLWNRKVLHAEVDERAAAA